MSKILTLRGEVFVGNLEPFDPDDPDRDITVTANVMRSLGIISKFTLEPTSERIKVQEWQSGLDATAASWTRVTGGKVKLMADESDGNNLALALGGRGRYVVPGSVSNARIAVQDPVTKKWSKLVATTPLLAGVLYSFVQAYGDGGLSFDPYVLIDPATFVLTDASATPKTLAIGVDYTLDPVGGRIALTNTAAHGVNLPGLTYPLKADFDQGFFINTLPVPLAQGAAYMLDHKSVRNVTLRDSSAPLKTIPSDYYTLDADYGMLTITDLAAIEATAGLTLPLRVYGVRGNVMQIGILTASTGLLEMRLRMNGVNQRTRQKMVVTLYKVSFDTAAIDFFDKDYTKTPLEAELLADPTKPMDEALGQYGMIEYL